MRKQIRDTVKDAVEALTELRTTAVGRRHEFNTNQLPAVAIFTDNEESEPVTIGPRTFLNTVDLIIRLDVKPSSLTSGEDETDEILAAIDAVVLPAVDAIDGILDVYSVSIATEGDGEADADYLQTTRTYAVEYHSEGNLKCET